MEEYILVCIIVVGGAYLGSRVCSPTLEEFILVCIIVASASHGSIVVGTLVSLGGDGRWILVGFTLRRFHDQQVYQPTLSIS